MKLNEIYSIREKNLKNLGNGIIPTESDVEKFEKWKKRERNKMLIACIYSLFILILIGTILLLSGVALESRLIDKIFGIIAYLLLGWAEIILIKRYLKSRFWKIEYCNYGKIIDKYHFASSGRNGRNSNTHIIVLANEKKININTSTITEYRKMQLNDEVIVFAVDNKKLYIIKK